MGAEFFKWSDEYSVSSEVLDNQHKQLFALTNELYEAFAAGDHKERMGEIIQRLHDYTVYHFKEEEKLLKSKGQALSEEHLAQHQEFIKKIKDISERHKTGRATVTFGLMSFLRSWLTDHIMQTDHKYKPVLESH